MRSAKSESDQVAKESEQQEYPAALRWALEYLPHYFTERPCGFHVELFRDLEAGEVRRMARVAPRGHAKSTCAALAFPLWCICERKRRNIVIITHELGLATQFVRDMRTELETNERILGEYGDLCQESADCADSGGKEERSRKGAKLAEDGPKRSAGKWTEEKFTTCTGVTVQARGVGGSFRGLRAGPHRPDLIVCDDIEKDEHVYSAEGRAKLEQWMRRVVMPALAPDGRLVVLGSMIHYDCLLAGLADGGRWARWDHRTYRAIEVRSAKSEERSAEWNAERRTLNEEGRNAEGRMMNAEKGDSRKGAKLAMKGAEHCSQNSGTQAGWGRRALWPGRWPLSRLDAEREAIGTLAFEQEYQANPIDDSTRVFRAEWLRRWEAHEVVEERVTTVMAVDPATGTASGDYFALWVGSIDRSSGVIFTRQLTLERIGIVQQIERIVEAFRAWRPVRIGIETVAYQAALKQILEERSGREGLYLPIVGITPTGSKEARIQGSSAFYENGLFRLPKGLAAEVERQFLEFPRGRHDDGPDVCAMGIELARQCRGSAAPFERTRVMRREEEEEEYVGPGVWIGGRG